MPRNKSASLRTSVADSLQLHHYALQGRRPSSVASVRRAQQEISSGLTWGPRTLAWRSWKEETRESSRTPREQEPLPQSLHSRHEISESGETDRKSPFFYFRQWSTATLVSMLLDSRGVYFISGISFLFISPQHAALH